MESCVMWPGGGAKSTKCTRNIRIIWIVQGGLPASGLASTGHPASPSATPSRFLVPLFFFPGYWLLATGY